MGTSTMSQAMWSNISSSALFGVCLAPGCFSCTTVPAVQTPICMLVHHRLWWGWWLLCHHKFQDFNRWTSWGHWFRERRAVGRAHIPAGHLCWLFRCWISCQAESHKHTSLASWEVAKYSAVLCWLHHSLTHLPSRQTAGGPAMCDVLQVGQHSSVK